MFDMRELDRARVRWQLGHHLFFSFVQSLIIICASLRKHLDNDDLAAARADIERATYVLWAVAVTFKLTGDFSQAAYDGYVRPNMFEASEETSQAPAPAVRRLCLDFDKGCCS